MLHETCTDAQPVANGSPAENTAKKKRLRRPRQPSAFAFTRPQAADQLCMGVRTLDTHIANRSIGYVRAGGKIIFRPCDIELFLARHAVSPRELSGAIL